MYSMHLRLKRKLTKPKAHSTRTRSEANSVRCDSKARNEQLSKFTGSYGQLGSKEAILVSGIGKRATEAKTIAPPRIEHQEGAE